MRGGTPDAPNDVQIARALYCGYIAAILMCMIPRENEDDNRIVESSMRIPKKIRDALTRLAKQHKRSFNGELAWALEQYVEQEDDRSRRRGASRRQ